MILLWLSCSTPRWPASPPPPGLREVDPATFDGRQPKGALDRESWASRDAAPAEERYAEEVRLFLEAEGPDFQWSPP